MTRTFSLGLASGRGLSLAALLLLACAGPKAAAPPAATAAAGGATLSDAERASVLCVSRSRRKQGKRRASQQKMNAPHDFPPRRRVFAAGVYGRSLSFRRTYLKGAQGVNSCAEPHKRLAAHQQE